MGTPTYPPVAYPAYGAPFEPKPTAAFVLSLIGGVLILLGGASELWLTVAHRGAFFAPPYSDGLVVLGLAGIALGSIVVASSALLFLYPHDHVVYGVLILVLSVLSVISYAGYLVGLVRGVVGGALAIAWAPVRWFSAGYGPGGWPYPSPSSPAVSHRVCLKCGRLIGLESRFCS
ncbi:MAG: DUF6114 domain-containing protein, partial [Thermoplasmata archaeon]